METFWASGKLFPSLIRFSRIYLETHGNKKEKVGLIIHNLWRIHWFDEKRRPKAYSYRTGSLHFFIIGSWFNTRRVTRWSTVSMHTMLLPRKQSWKICPRHWPFCTEHFNHCQWFSTAIRYQEWGLPRAKPTVLSRRHLFLQLVHFSSVCLFVWSAQPVWTQLDRLAICWIPFRVACNAITVYFQHRINVNERLRT
jgi:hypothetical protein